MTSDRKKTAYRALWAWLGVLLVVFLVQHFRARPARAPGAGELERLRQQNLLLEAHVRDLEAQLSLRDQAERLFGGFQPIPARILPVPDASPRVRSATIDAGHEQGVRVGHGVVGEAGLVGQVVETGAGRSRVRLADDAGFRVGFQLGGRRGIAAGGPAPGEAHPLFLKDPVEFRPGDLVLTDGGDGRFPRNVVIGTVVEASLPYQHTRIALAERLEHTAAVVVLVPAALVDAPEGRR